MNWTDKRDEPKYAPPNEKMWVKVCEVCGRTVITMSDGQPRDPQSAGERAVIWFTHGLEHTFVAREPGERRPHACPGSPLAKTTPETTPPPRSVQD